MTTHSTPAKTATTRAVDIHALPAMLTALRLPSVHRQPDIEVDALHGWSDAVARQPRCPAPTTKLAGDGLLRRLVQAVRSSLMLSARLSPVVAPSGMVAVRSAAARRR